MEDEFAEILVERQEDSLLVRTESGDYLVQDTGALFSDREDIPTRLSERFQGRPRDGKMDAEQLRLYDEFGIEVPFIRVNQRRYFRIICDRQAIGM